VTTSDIAVDYRDVLRIRRFEEQVLALARSGEITGSVHLCIGQEAVPVGSCRSLHPEDRIVATYRGHGWALSRGVPMVEMFAELLGRASALCGGRGGSAYLMAPEFGFLGENSIVGAGLPMGLGASLASKFRGDGGLALVSIGDGALNQGVVHETLNMAAVLRIPLVVVVENNGYAEMTPADALTAVPAHVRAASYDIPGLVVDGNEVAAVQAVVAQARERSLTVSTPVIVEAMTHRLVGHYSGDVQAYRPSGELEDARQREPVARLARQILDHDELLRIENAVDAELLQAVEAARKFPFPDVSTVTDYLYA
jgi:TPP-dependent pyruvate/acetoin dehydrogenase alpha subunit